MSALPPPAVTVPGVGAVDEAWVVMHEDVAARDERAVRASDPTLAPAAQLALIDDESVVVRENLAHNPSVTLEVQLALTQDPSGEVLDMLAHNASLHPRAQEALAGIGDSYCLTVLAENPVLDASVMTTLSTHGDDTVREALGRNPSISGALAQLLVEDVSPEVVRAAAHNTALRLHTDLPVPVLHASERGRADVARHLRGLDQSASEALEPSWCGTLKELKSALEAFAS